MIFIHLLINQNITFHASSKVIRTESALIIINLLNILLTVILGSYTIEITPLLGRDSKLAYKVSDVVTYYQL